MPTTGWITISIIITLHLIGMIYTYRDFRAQKAQELTNHPESTLNYSLEDTADHVIYFLMIFFWEVTVPFMLRYKDDVIEEEA